jgi:NADH-quinone oxidoreductase subunit F
VRLYGVSGHVKTPGRVEAAVGITLRELIYDLGGGVRTASSRPSSPAARHPVLRRTSS